MIDKNKQLLRGIAALALAVGAFGLAACGGNDTTEPVNQSAISPATEAPSDLVILSEAAVRSAGISMEPVSAGGLGAEIISQAIVSASPAGEAVVTARAGGAVTRVFKRLGDPVRAGEALAIVESRDAAQIAADRSVANARANLAQKALARERYLYEQKVSPRVDLERAQAEAAVAAAESRRAQAAAGAANISGDGRSVILTSPISGRITATTVRLGAFVSPETELFRVSDPRQIQIEAAVGPADAVRLAPGDRAVVEVAGGSILEGTVRAVTPTLSGETRAVTAVIDMPSAGLQPGLAVRVRLFPSRGGSTTAIVVPEESVQSVNGADVAFIRTPQGFRAQQVRTGQRSAGRVEIASGLKPGQVVATTNAFLLKAELGKGAGEEE